MGGLLNKKRMLVGMIILIFFSSLGISVFALGTWCLGNTKGDCPSWCVNNTHYQSYEGCGYEEIYYCDILNTYTCGEGMKCITCDVESEYSSPHPSNPTIHYCIPEGADASTYCENPISPPGQTAICEDITDKDTCNGVSDCAWCPVPQDFDDYPYDFNDIYPDGIEIKNNHACVNTTFDPLNCGGCGFTEGSSVTEKVCSGQTPFCENKNCVAKADFDDEDARFYETFFPYEVSSTDGVSYSSSGSASVFLLGQIDEDSAVCEAAAPGADFIEGIGCCGNNKCRIPSLQGESSLCHITALCDGHQWHTGEESTEGEVFIAPSCSEEWDNYPIVQLEGEYVRCVDHDDQEGYLAAYSGHPQMCLPEENAGNDFEGFLRGEGSYYCGSGEYAVGGTRYTPHANPCDGHVVDAEEVLLAYERGTDLLCTGFESDMTSGDVFAFVSIVDAPGNIGTVGSIGHGSDGGGIFNYKNCPAVIRNWTTGGSNYWNTMVEVACPGRISIALGAHDVSLDNVANENTWLFNLGYSSAYRMAYLCRPPVNSSDSNTIEKLTALNYVFTGSDEPMGTVEGHEYMCSATLNTPDDGFGGDVEARVHVCCGDAGCDDIPGEIGTGGIKYDTGEYMALENGRLYCLGNGSWGTDFDNESLQDECADSGFIGTGSYCCAEQDDTSTLFNESYNDPGSQTGACFKGMPQDNSNFLFYNDVEYSDVLVSNGSFYGCGFASAEGVTLEREYPNESPVCVPDADGVLPLECLLSVEDWPNPGSGGEDTQTGEPLIERVAYCKHINTTSDLWYCSYDNNWTYSYGPLLSHDSVVPADLMDYLREEESVSDNARNASCCEPNKCWDPNKGLCVGASSDYYKINETLAYACSDGEWVNVFATAKRTPDNCYAGTCPQDSQCLYNIAGDASQNNNVSSGANPRCIGDGQVIEDFVCISGNWTTRTKLLAEKLISLAGSDDDFVLMCGPAEEVLVNKQNIGESNNFCVLNLDGQRIIGTTLNQPLYDEDHNDFITALEQSFYLSYPDSGISFDSSCDEDTDDFEKCVDNDFLKLYYDDGYNMVVFSDERVSLSLGLGEQICDALPDWLKWLCPNPSQLEEDMQKLSLFNKVYAARQGTRKRVFGVSEESCDQVLAQKSEFFTFNYTGFSSLDLSHLVLGLEGDEVVFDNNHVFIKNPDSDETDVWTALTLLRTPEQE